jgi:MEDS: MEthanogen/methylotroph, DcmR Sensory domain
MIQAVGSQPAAPLEQTNVGEPVLTGDSSHFVQFYEADACLLESLTEYIKAGLRSGDRCIVVATQAHRDGLEERLQADGVDVTRLVASDQYMGVDAAETLSRFMVGGQPDQQRFRDVLGSVLFDRASNRRRVRVFGEMVALLWGQGNRAAAMRLEVLWNDLGKAHRFSLFCAYPMLGFHGEAQTECFRAICSSHSDVIPAENYAEASAAPERRRSIALLQQRALSLELEVAERKGAEQEVRRLNKELKQKVDEYARVVRELEESRLTLNEKLKDLELFHDLTVGRELKMIALEKELSRIKSQPRA